MNLEAPGLETALLRFVPLDASHRSLFLNKRVEDALWAYMPALPGGTRFEDYVDFFIKAQVAGLYTGFVMYRKADNAFVGLTAFTDTNRLHRRTRIAVTWFEPEIYTPDLFDSMTLGLLQRASDWGARRVEWSINPKNDFWVENVARIAPNREATLRNYERMADGQWADKTVYSFIGAEIKTAISRLREREDA